MARKGQLTVRVIGDTKPVEKSLDDMTGMFKGFAAGALGIVGGLGIAGGALLVKEFGDALERDKMGDKLAAQLNLTGPAAEQAGEIAGDLYANAYGDSLEEVHDAVGAVMSSLGDLAPDQVEDLTAKALDLAAAFDVDVNESVNAAGVMLRQGLARDGDHAFDLLVRSMQSVPQTMRNELIPIIEEYGQDFAALGIDGQDAFGLLVEAAQDGRFELDKTGDALKELTIRATDMSDASQAAYETIGLDAKEMADAIVQGGDTAREAFDKIVDGLIAIEDPSEKANTAIALMGTPLEDLSVTEIPAFLERLDDMGAGFGDVEGAADDMGTTLNDNVATDFETFKRKAGAALETFIQDNVLPGVAQILDAFEEDGIGGALDTAIDLWEEAQPRVQAWWDDTFVPFWEDTAKPWAAYIGGEIATALINAMLDVIVNSWQSLNAAFLKALSKAVYGLPLVGDELARVIAEGAFTIGGAQINAPDISNPVGRPDTGGGSSGATLGPERPGGRLASFHTGGLIAASVPRMSGDGPSERTIRARVGEYVSPVGASDPSAVKPYVTPFGGGGGDLHVHFEGPVAGEQEILRIVQRAAREHKRRSGTTGLN